jgi:hypothetical protein
VISDSLKVRIKAGHVTEFVRSDKPKEETFAFKLSLKGEPLKIPVG